ncbi:MAG: AI-2E family transporter [Euzebya sp.]
MIASVSGIPPAGSEPTPGADSSSLLLDQHDLAGATRRLSLDWKTFVYLVAAALAAYALLAVARGTSTTLTRVGIGLLLALALDPLADAIQNRTRMRRGFAVAVVAGGLLGLGALLIGVLGPKAVAEASQFSEQLPTTLDEMERLPLVGGYLRDNDASARVQQWIEDLPSQITEDRVSSTASTLVNGIASVAVVVVLVVAVLIDGKNLTVRVRRLLPSRRRDQADEVGRVVYRTLGRYFGGSITVAVMMGLFVLTVGLVLGIPLVPLAAIWAMLTDLIPQIGGFLGGSLFVLLAVTQGVPTALIAGAGFVLYMNIENHLIQPAIVGRSVDLTPPTTMVAAFVGGAIAGVPGALMATPLVGAVKALYSEARGTAEPDDGRAGGLLGRLRNMLPGRRRAPA